MFRRSLHVLCVLLPVVSCCLAVGCGTKGIHRVSGKVTFNGQPIPTGKVYFFPNGSKGNSGPSGFADISDGSFDTSSRGGRGAPPGAMIVRIEGFKPLAVPKEDITTEPLFYPYEVAADLPASSSTHTFDVPAEAAKNPPKAVGTPAVIP